MQQITKPPRKSFKPYAILSTMIAFTGAAGALVAGVAPASAANFVQNPDTQIAMFLVPLSLLLAAVLFEVARFSLRGPLPGEAVPAPRRRPWSPGRREG
jgi:hypothetical protein